MKKLITAIAILATMQTSAQVFAGFGPGISSKGNVLGDLSLGYQYKIFIVQAGYQSQFNSAEPLLLQLRGAVQLPLGNHFYVQPFAGYCRYQMSSDDKSRNSNSYVAGVELLRFELEDGAWFIGYTQTKQHSIFSCGLRYWFGGGPWNN